MTTYLIAGLVIAALIGAVWMYGRSRRAEGAASVERDQAKQESDHARQRHEIDESVARMSGPELDRELFDQPKQ